MKYTEIKIIKNNHKSSPYFNVNIFKNINFKWTFFRKNKKLKDLNTHLWSSRRKRKGLGGGIIDLR